MYFFHGAKPPALHLINFLLFIWLKLYSSFSLGNFPVFWKTQTVGALVNHHLRSHKSSHFICLCFCRCWIECCAGIEKKKQKLICQDQIVRRWNYSHQDQSRSNVGECSLWLLYCIREGKDLFQFPCWFGFPWIIAGPTGGKLKQERGRKCHHYQGLF